MSSQAQPARPRRPLRAWSAVLGLGLALGVSLSAAAALTISDPTPHSVVPAPVCKLDSMDFIHKKIDVSAQYSLMRKMAGDRPSQIEATSIYMAIQDGRLAGVYLPPRKPVSDRGARMKPARGYWDLIPKGQNSTCLDQPAGEAPMIVYRQKLSRAQLDKALSEAWRECDLGNVPEPCEYTVVNKPPPEVECRTDKDCTSTGKGDFCNTDFNVCGRDMDGGVVIGPTCGYPRCDPAISTTIYAACGYNGANAPIRCNAIPGERCGVCDNVSKKARACHAANETRRQAGNKKCRDDYKPAKVAKYSIECVKAMVGCEAGSRTDCLKAAKCMVDPQPYKEYRECLDRESARYFKEQARCKKK